MGLIADMNTVISNGPTAATTAKAIAPAGPIVDYPGQLQSVLLTLQEAKNKIGGGSGTGGLIADTDAADPNLATLQTVYNGL